MSEMKNMNEFLIFNLEFLFNLEIRILEIHILIGIQDFFFLISYLMIVKYIFPLFVV